MKIAKCQRHATCTVRVCVCVCRAYFISLIREPETTLNDIPDGASSITFFLEWLYNGIDSHGFDFVISLQYYLFGRLFILLFPLYNCISWTAFRFCYQNATTLSASSSFLFLRYNITNANAKDQSFFSRNGPGLGPLWPPCFRYSGNVIHGLRRHAGHNESPWATTGARYSSVGRPEIPNKYTIRNLAVLGQYHGLGFF